MDVFSRCDRPPLSTFALNGRRGCDLEIHRVTGLPYEPAPPLDIN